MAPGIVAPLLATVLCLAFACAWSWQVVRPAKPGAPRVLRSVPALAAFLATPMLFDRVSQPFWVYAAAGIFAWWSAHKLAAFTLGRGPLSIARSPYQMAFMLLIPAAFVDPSLEATSQEARVSGETARALLKESAGVLVGRAALKFGVAMGLAMVIIAMPQGTTATTATGIGAGALQHLRLFLFDLIIYCLFSFVMDGPLGLLRLAKVNAAVLPHFDQPFLSTSVRELWARRWNISAGSILRELVYWPVCDVLTGKPLVVQHPTAASEFQQQQHARKRDSSPQPSAQGLRQRGDRTAAGNAAVADTAAAAPGDTSKPPQWVRLVAAVATFAMSGLQHELIMFYCSGWRGVTGRMFAFFTIQVAAILGEMVLERMLLGPQARKRNAALLATSLPYRIARTLLMLAVVLTLAELFWWPPFLNTGLDKRLLREWSCWVSAAAKAVGGGKAVTPAAAAAAAATHKSAMSVVPWPLSIVMQWTLRGAETIILTASGWMARLLHSKSAAAAASAAAQAAAGATIGGLPLEATHKIIPRSMLQDLLGFA